MFGGRVGNPVAWRCFGMEGKTGMEGGGDALAMEGIATDSSLVPGMAAFSPLGRRSENIGLGLGLLDALAERGGRHDAVGRVRAAGGLADDEFVERDAVLGDLEERGSGECATGAREQTRAVAIEALVVELHVVLWTTRR